MSRPPAVETSSGAPPTVSVLMPVYNGERYLREAVDSILRQSFTDFEFVIVDDGSTDGTRAVLDGIDDPRLRVISNERNVGVTRALNIGLEAARGRYIARLDADDVAHRERLARQVAVLEANADIVLLGSGYDAIDEAGVVVERIRRPLTDAEFRWMALLHAPVIHPSVMFRAWLIRDLGLRYDVGLVTGQDYDMWARMLAYGKAARLGEPLVTWRRHVDAVGVARRRQQVATTAAIARDNVAGLYPARAGDRDAIARLTEIQSFGSPAPIGWRDATACLRAVNLLLRSFFARPPRPLSVDDRIAVTRTAALLLFGVVLRKGRLHKRPFLTAYFLIRAYRYLPALLTLAARRLTPTARP